MNAPRLRALNDDPSEGILGAKPRRPFWRQGFRLLVCFPTSLQRAWIERMDDEEYADPLGEEPLDDNVVDRIRNLGLTARSGDEQAIHDAAAALAGQPVQVPEWFRQAHGYAADYIEANADDPNVRATAQWLAGMPRSQAEQSAEEERRGAAQARARRHDKIAEARLDPSDPDWLIEQIRLEQIAKTDQLVAEGKLKPWNPGEYMRELQRKAVAGGSPLTRSQLIEMTRSGYAYWLQEKSKPRRQRPRRPRTRDPIFELITNPPDRQCGYVDGIGYFCALYSELSLTVICRTCGKVPAQVCLEHFDDVLRALEDEQLRCTAETAGSHQIVHIVEGRTDAAFG